MRKAKENLQSRNVISLPGTGQDSLESAINQFLLWEMRSRDCIEVKRCYIDIAKDLESGVLLSQIVYWHLPDKEGKQKLTVYRDGYWWLAKAREDWWAECRLTPKQFDRAIRHLEEQQLVCTKVYKWQGQNTKHIRLDWEGLLQSLSLLDTNQDSVVGFRRRDPVPGSGRKCSKIPYQVNLELPIRESSELPIREFKDNLIGNSRITNQVSSELPIRELHPYTENTSETTLPPNPPCQGGNESESEGIVSQEPEKPRTGSQPQSLALLLNQLAFLVPPLNTHEHLPSQASSLDSDTTLNKSSGELERLEQSSEPYESSSEHLSQPTHSVRKTEALVCSKGALPPWRQSWRPNGYHEGFVEYLQTGYLPKVGRWKETGEPPTPGDARNWIAGRESRGETAQIENKWEDYQEQLAKQQRPQLPPSSNTESIPQMLRPGDFSLTENETWCREYYKLGREEFLKAAEWRSSWLKEAEKFARFRNIMQGN